MAEVKIDLAHEPDILIGPLTVSPSRRELSRDGAHVVLEHRVMQVLIALHRAQATVVSRDDLIATCWEGRFVSDDALNRVISRLRRALSAVGGDVLGIETLSRIGYRLYRFDGHDAPPPGQALSDGRTAGRRAMVMGMAGMVGVTALGGLAWSRHAQRQVAPEILAMLEQSRQLMGQNTREGQYQGIAILRKVVEREPAFADGWGRLGIAYGIVSHYREKVEGDELRVRAQSAARRALDIDRNNALGETALSVALPFIGHYLERERHQTRALELDPGNYDALIYTAVALQFVGRNKEAVKLYKRLPKGPNTPADYNNFLRALWSAGLVEETDQQFARAVSLYPTQFTLWFTKLQMMLYGGRHQAAIAMASDLQSAPTGPSGRQSSYVIPMALAMETGDQRKIDQLIAERRTLAHQAGYRAEIAIRDVCALGRIDDAFAFCDAYYFNKGFRIPDSEEPGSGSTLNQRQTRFLFEPVSAPMRSDPRFADLMRRLRLDTYWQESGYPPDYLQPA